MTKKREAGIWIVEERVADLEKLLCVALENGTLRNLTTERQNLITGLEILVACGKRNLVEVEKWK